MKLNISTLLFEVILLFLVTNINAQDSEKNVTLTVNGQGKTQDEAKQNALRNAIEQAFGAFISSSTQILNDDLIKDEIVSISNGNIQEFSILSEIQTPDGYWSNTLKAVVSVNKLTSFCESKGIKVEFKGSLFAHNIKQQELNLKNEEIVVRNMCKVLSEVAENCFDYEIETSDPVKSNKDEFSNREYYFIPIKIWVSTNKNIETFSEYFYNTLCQLSMSETDVANYYKLNKEVYTIAIEKESDESIKAINKKQTTSLNVLATNERNIYFRSNESLKAIAELLLYFPKTLLNFQVSNDIDTIIGHQHITYDFGYGGGHETKTISIRDYSGFTLFLKRGSKLIISLLVHHRDEYNEGPYYLDVYQGYGKEYLGYHTNDFVKALNDKSYVLHFSKPKVGVRFVSLNYAEKRTIEEISKISGYKISYCRNTLIYDQKRSLFLPIKEGHDVDKKMTQKDVEPTSDVYWMSVDEMPVFNGGEAALRAFFSRSINYPVIAQENGIQGTVVVSIIINTDGSITVVGANEDADPSLAKEAKRVVSTLPKWTPGKHNGKLVRVGYHIPIVFKLE